METVQSYRGAVRIRRACDMWPWWRASVGSRLFPPLISSRKDLGSAVFTIAHEWTHHFLLIHPLGREYFFQR